MKKCIITLVVLSACIFIEVKAQDAFMVALTDSTEGYYLTNPFSSPSTLSLIYNQTFDNSSTSYPGLVNAKSNNSGRNEMAMVRNNHFFTQKNEENDLSEEHNLALNITGNNKISFSTNVYDGYQFSMLDVKDVNKVKNGTIDNGEIQLNGIASGHYLLIVHTNDKIHTKLINIE